ncbi:MAG: hypothetical protein U0Y82_15260 [Thermoleophilia bacterium]
MAESAKLTRTQARTLLGVPVPGGDGGAARGRPVGGERQRLSLAMLVARGGNLLVLDEPTNHLDAEGREALEDALQAYEGTILFVPHDRALIDAVATRTIAIEDLVAGGARGRVGRAAAGPGRGPGAPAVPGARAARAPKRRRGRRRRRPRSARASARQLETRVGKLETELTDVQTALADPANLGDHELLTALGARHRELEEDLAYAMAEWERAAEAAGT